MNSQEQQLLKEAFKQDAPSMFTNTTGSMQKKPDSGPSIELKKPEEGDWDELDFQRWKDDYREKTKYPHGKGYGTASQIRRARGNLEGIHRRYRDRPEGWSRGLEQPNRPRKGSNAYKRVYPEFLREAYSNVPGGVSEVQRRALESYNRLPEGIEDEGRLGRMVDKLMSKEFYSPRPWMLANQIPIQNQSRSLIKDISSGSYAPPDSPVTGVFSGNPSYLDNKDLVKKVGPLGNIEIDSRRMNPDNSRDLVAGTRAEEITHAAQTIASHMDNRPSSIFDHKTTLRGAPVYGEHDKMSGELLNDLSEIKRFAAQEKGYLVDTPEKARRAVQDYIDAQEEWEDEYAQIRQKWRSKGLQGEKLYDKVRQETKPPLKTTIKYMLKDLDKFPEYKDFLMEVMPLVTQRNRRNKSPNTHTGSSQQVERDPSDLTRKRKKAELLKGALTKNELIKDAMSDEDKKRPLFALGGGLGGGVLGWAAPYFVGNQPVEGLEQLIPAGIGATIGAGGGLGASYATNEATSGIRDLRKTLENLKKITNAYSW